MLFWHWIAAGFALMAVEIIAPSFFFLWLGAAAIAVGVIMLVIPDLWWSYQWTLFAVFGISSFFLSRRFLKNKKLSGPASMLNKPAERWIGEVVVIETAIENGRGKAKVGDSLWSVTGPDMPVGARAKVIGVDGTELKVEKA